MCPWDETKRETVYIFCLILKSGRGTSACIKKEAKIVHR